jgi:hypothetical protein
MATPPPRRIAIATRKQMIAAHLRVLRDIFYLLNNGVELNERHGHSAVKMNSNRRQCCSSLLHDVSKIFLLGYKSTTKQYIDLNQN